MCSFFQLVFGFRRPLIQLGTGFDLAPLALEDSLSCMWWHGYGRNLVACNQIGAAGTACSENIGLSNSCHTCMEEKSAQ